MKKLDKDIIRKWSPMVESMICIKNEFLMEHICNFCEWYVKDDKNSYSLTSKLDTLSSQLDMIRDNIQNSNRVSIVGQFFNPITCVSEYKLSNGRYVPIDGHTEYELSFDDILRILGPEYVRNFFPDKFRDDQINRVI